MRSATGSRKDVSMLSRRAKSLWGFGSVCLCVALASASPAHAQSHRGHFGASGGVTPPVSTLSDYTDPGWHVRFGGGYNLSNNFTIGVDYNYNGLDTDDRVYSQSVFDSIPGLAVDVHYWSINLNAMYSFFKDHDIFPNIIGGVGFFNRTVELSTPSAIYIPPYWDPWWGWVGGGWTTAQQILGSDSQGGFGANVGFGLNIKIDGGAVLFAEARYQHAWLEGVDIDAIPVSFGVRW